MVILGQGSLSVSLQIVSNEFIYRLYFSILFRFRKETAYPRKDSTRITTSTGYRIRAYLGRGTTNARVRCVFCLFFGYSRGAYTLLGSGPEGVDHLCFHTYGGFSPSPSTSPPSNSSLEAQIPVSRPKSQPLVPNPGLKTQILALRPKSQLQGPNLREEAQILNPML